MNSVTRLERALLLAGFSLLVGSMLLVASMGRSAAGVSFTETFDGDPAAPQPWDSSNWDISVHARGG